MPTTLNIETPILDEVKRIRRKEGGSLGQVVSCLLAEALCNLRGLVAHPRVRTLAEKEDFLTAYAEVTSAFPVRGNLVPVAHLATLLRQHGVRTIYANDLEFKKFEFLRAQNPFAD